MERGALAGDCPCVTTSPKDEDGLIWISRRCDLRGLYSAVAVFVLGSSSWVSAQDSAVDRAAQGQAGKDIRVGVDVDYVQPD